MKTTFKSVIEILDYYGTDEKCVKLLEQQRWPKGPVCPHCGSVKTPYKIEGGKRYKCSEKGCNKKFSVLVGTIFENTKIELRYWFAGIYLISAHKKGISSHQLARDLGITQKSAWFVLHRVREMLKAEGAEKLSGEVEVDETYVGGKFKNKHLKELKAFQEAGITDNKTPVVGAVQRKGKIVCKKLESVNKQSLIGFMVDNVKESTLILSDSERGYKSLPTKGFNHEIVNHSAGEYVRTAGEVIVHTNTIENFWSLLKRGIIGIYHQVSDKHLDRYCAEFSYRYNSRDITDNDRFFGVLKNANGRLKYKDLIAE